MPRRLAVVVGSLFLFGCSDSLAPEDVAGLYVLERIGAEALPAVLFENEYGVVWVSSEAIRLRSDGSGTISSVQQSIPRQDRHTVTGPEWSEQRLRFRTARGRIEIELLCAPNELCLPPPHLVARRTTDGLRVTRFQSPILLHYAQVVSAE